MAVLKVYDGSAWVTIAGGTGGTHPVDLSSDVTGSLAIANGGTGNITAQAAIDALTSVSGATDEHVLTKDTASGNAIFKAATGGGDPDQNLYETFIGDSGTTTASTTTDTLDIEGGTGITTTASTDKVSVALDTPVAVTNGGTGLSSLATANALIKSDGTPTNMEEGTVTHPSANKLDECGEIQSNDSNLDLLDSDGDIMFRARGTGASSDVNYLEAGAALTGADPTITAKGETNVGVKIVGRGTGDITLNPQSTGDILLTPTSGNTEVTTGDVKITDGHVHYGAIQNTNIGAGGGNIDWTTCNIQQITLTADAGAITFTAPTGVAVLHLRILQDTTGGWTLAAGDWPSTVKWIDNVHLVNTEDANGWDWVYLIWDGTNYSATFGPNFS